MHPSRTIVVGAQGLVGGAFFKSFPALVGTHHKKTDTLKKLDLMNPDLKEVVGDQEYSSAIIAAGIPNILQCEREPDLTHRCNVEGTLQLVEQLCNRKITPVLFSTDYVFDGKAGGYREESLTNPLNQYGKQKAELERRLATHFKGEYLIIRLSKVYGIEKGDKTLIDEMVATLVNRKRVRAAFDQIFCPVFVEDIVKVVASLVKEGARGVYHVCGDETISRLDLARDVCRALGASMDLIEPISLKDLSEPFLRPLKTDMSNRKACHQTGIQMNSLKTSIQRIIEQWM